MKTKVEEVIYAVDVLKDKPNLVLFNSKLWATWRSLIAMYDKYGFIPEGKGFYLS